MDVGVRSILSEEIANATAKRRRRTMMREEWEFEDDARARIEDIAYWYSVRGKEVRRRSETEREQGRRYRTHYILNKTF